MSPPFQASRPRNAPGDTPARKQNDKEYRRGRGRWQVRRWGGGRSSRAARQWSRGAGAAPGTTTADLTAEDAEDYSGASKARGTGANSDVSLASALEEATARMLHPASACDWLRYRSGGVCRSVAPFASAATISAILAVKEAVLWYWPRACRSGHRTGGDAAENECSPSRAL